MALGMATSEPDASFLAYTAAEGAAIGFFLGAAVGSIAGFFIGVTRVRPTYEINQSREKWLRVKSNFEGVLTDRKVE